MHILVSCLLLAVACGDGSTWGERHLPRGHDSGARGDTADSAGPADTADSDSGEDCPDGVICVEALPYTHSADTRHVHTRDFDAYACAPTTDESGPEVVYRVVLEEAGYLGVLIDDDTEGVDIDAHLLGSLDPEDCLDRGDRAASDHLEAGTWYMVADTYVSAGEEQSGPYTLTMGQVVPHVGSCDMEEGWMDRVGDGGDRLAMPATGPVVQEAHLVTVEDGYGTSTTDPWPATQSENIASHYATSQDATGLVMARSDIWAPQEGCEYGQGAYGAKLPVVDEGWYVNMYWEDRPEAGTRMIVMNASGRAVVAAAGYETGPGDLNNIAGVTEEIHHYLGTVHESELTVGFAADPDLPLGPIVCE